MKIAGKGQNMKSGFISLVSENHDESKIDEKLEEFYRTLERGIGCRLEDLEIPLVFIKSGGTEGLFKKRFEGDNGPFYLLTTSLFNSLPAAIEILTYLRQRNINGEIVHGTTEIIIEKIKKLQELYERQK